VRAAGRTFVGIDYERAARAWRNVGSRSAQRRLPLLPGSRAEKFPDTSTLKRTSEVPVTSRAKKRGRGPDRLGACGSLTPRTRPAADTSLSEQQRSPADGVTRPLAGDCLR
jgi:hypothetical protein